MTQDTTTVSNRLGIHARPAAMFVSHASKFKSEIFIEKNGLKVNGKSIMGVMMLAAEMGSKLTIFADGAVGSCGVSGAANNCNPDEWGVSKFCKSSHPIFWRAGMSLQSYFGFSRRCRAACPLDGDISIRQTSRSVVRRRAAAKLAAMVVCPTPPRNP